MRLVISLILFFVLIPLFTPRAHAIIFLPAIVLIPIAKVVALIIGSLSVPALGIGALWSRLFRKSLRRTTGVILLFIVLLTAILFIVFKLHNPDRPLF